MKHVRRAVTVIAGAAALIAAGSAHGQIFLEPRPAWQVYVTPVPPVFVNQAGPVVTEQALLPPPPPPAPAPPPLHIVQADVIKAQEVRADTIYATSIKAKQINGTVHQQRDMPFTTRGTMGVPSVVASTIYANRIDARAVTAKNISVRTVERD